MNPSTPMICPIEGMGYDQRFGQYLLSLKIGQYQTFNSYLHTNQRHYHDCYELVLVLEGHGSFEYQGLTQSLKAGDLFLSEPFTEHEIHITPSGSLTVFYLFFKESSNTSLTNNCYEEQLIQTFIDHHNPFKHKNKPLLSYIQFINNYCTANQRINDQWTARMVFDFLFNCLERLSSSPPQVTTNYGNHELNTFEHILDYIDQNIEKNITAMTISKAVGLSKSTLYNMFRDHLDCTVHSYIKERKIALAKHYLVMHLPVGEVAGLVGYKSLAQFSRTFKAVTGSTPRDYVKSNSKIPIGIGRRLTEH